MPATFEKYMSGQHQVAGSLQRNVREYYNDLKLLRADTQVGAARSRCWGMGCVQSSVVWRASLVVVGARWSPVQPTVYGQAQYHDCLPAHLPCTQIYYPVPNEVYRDEWDDVQVSDPMEFTHCRYTPVVTEVRWWRQCSGRSAAGRLQQVRQQSIQQHCSDAVMSFQSWVCGPETCRMPATLASMVTLCASSAWTAISSCSSASPCTTRTRTSCGRRSRACAR